MHENTCTFNSSYASKLLIQWEHFSTFCPTNFVGASLPGATISKARESLDTAGPRTRSVIKSSDMATSGPGRHGVAPRTWLDGPRDDWDLAFGQKMKMF